MNRGPRPEGSAEDAFVKNLRNAVASWLQRLRSPHALHEAPAIGQEAFELRGIAEKHGLGAIVEQLRELERASRESPYSAIITVTVLEQLIAPSNRDAAPLVPGFAPNPNPIPIVNGNLNRDLNLNLNLNAPFNAARPGSQRPAMPLKFDPSASMGPSSIALPPLIGDLEPTQSPPLLNQANLPAPPPQANRAAPTGPQSPQNEPVRLAPERLQTMASQRGDGWQRPPPMVAEAPRGARPQAPPQASDLPESTARPPAPPKLLLKTVLHLRAFGKSGPDSVGRMARAKDASAQERNSLLGFRGISQNAPVAPPPPDLSARAPSYPPRDEETPGPPRVITRPPTPARGSSAPGPLRRPSGPVPAARGTRPKANGAPRWFYIVGGLVALLAVTTVVIVVVSSTRVVAPAKSDAATARVSPDAGQAGDGPARPTEAVHGVGRETNEMRALIDQQDQMIAKCRLDASKCDKWARHALLLGQADAGALLPITRSANGQPSWLQHLTLPADLETKDDPSLLSFLEYVTKNVRGREDFQQLLFNCSQYMDLFDATLKKYGVPSWLKFVAFQESHCVPQATSPVGARGLWQFMPDTARGYGLMVNEDEIDERLNPAKSTEAAVHFLTDLYAKLGAWDLTLAGYNAGPYTISQRLVQVGGGAGFWDLRRSDLLPKETAEYVPAIEVYALVVENRQRFKFVMTLPLPQAAAELNVRPGTRLSLIARVARTSLSKIKELNPDFLSAVVPSKVTTMRIPVAGEQAFQVQQELNSWPEDDTKDTCVPRDYVWGSNVFEQTPYAKKCAKNPPPQ